MSLTFKTLAQPIGLEFDINNFGDREHEMYDIVNIEEYQKIFNRYMITIKFNEMNRDRDTFERWVRTKLTLIIGNNEVSWTQCDIAHTVWRSGSYLLKFYVSRERYESDLLFLRKFDGDFGPKVYATYENDHYREYGVCKEFIEGQLISEVKDEKVLEKYAELIIEFNAKFRCVDCNTENFVLDSTGRIRCFDFDSWAM